MLERVLKLIVVLTLLLFLAQAVIGVVVRATEAIVGWMAAALGALAGLTMQLLAWMVIVAFLVGLLIRGVQFVLNRDPRTARERTARDRAMRQRVRRPAEGVPPIRDQRGQVLDRDPALNEDREAR